MGIGWRIGRPVALLGRPGIVQGNALAIGTNHLLDDIVAVVGIRQLHIGETGGRRHRQDVHRIPSARRTGVQRGGGRLIGDDLVGGVVRFIHAQGLAVQRQEIAHRVAPRLIHPHVAHQEMGNRLFENRRGRPAQFIGVRHRCRKTDELTGQRRQHVPATHFRRIGRDIAKVDQQHRLSRLIIHRAAGNGEIDQQALRVILDFRLRRIDAHIACGRQAVVPDPNPKGIRLRGFNRRGKGVVANHLFGEEVIQGQLWQRLDGNKVRRDLDRLGYTAQRITQRRADEIQGAGRRNRRAGGRNNEPVNFAGGVRLHPATAINVRDTGHGIDPDKELRTGIIGIRGGNDAVTGIVLEIHAHPHIIDRQSIEIIVDLHHGVEGLALKNQLLLNLDFYTRAHRLRRGRRRPGQNHQAHQPETRPIPRKNPSFARAAFHIFVPLDGSAICRRHRPTGLTSLYSYIP